MKTLLNIILLLVTTNAFAQYDIRQDVNDIRTLALIKNCEAIDSHLVKDALVDNRFSRTLYTKIQPGDAPTYIKTTTLGPLGSYSFEEAMEILELTKREHLHSLVDINSGYKCVTPNEIKEFSEGAGKVQKKQDTAPSQKNNGKQ